jgi:prepilin-type N-terminal cleavage/methylation domain-containing protein
MRHSRGGFTLIEVIMAVAILTSLATIGWGTMKSHLPRFRLIRIAKQFRGDLATMRGIAVQTNRESKMHLLSHAGDCSDPSDWGGSWEKSIGNKVAGSDEWDLLPEDSQIDGRDDDQSKALVDFTLESTERGFDVCFQDWGVLQGPSLGRNNRDAIVFSPRGWLRNPASDFNSRGYMEFIFINQDANRKGVVDAVKVQLSRSGMIRLVRVPQNYHLNPVGTDEASSTQ